VLINKNKKQNFLHSSSFFFAFFDGVVISSLAPKMAKAPLLSPRRGEFLDVF